MDHVLDPAYFGGNCQYVYNGEWNKFVYDALCENLHYNEDEKNYRKPYNYHAYRFVVTAIITLCNILCGKRGRFEQRHLNLSSNRLKQRQRDHRNFTKTWLTC